MNTIALLCPVHRRHRFLKVAAEQQRKIPGWVVYPIYFLDRTTDEVFDTVTDIVMKDNRPGAIVRMPRPIVKGAKGDFPTAWSWMTARAEEIVPEAEVYGIWDDDMILTYPELVPDALEVADMVYGPKLFIWDDFEYHNTKIEHNSVVYWRHQKGDRFHPVEVMQVHAPQGVHDNPSSRMTTLPFNILDYGFYSESDRNMVFRREIRTGKIDMFTLPLSEEPDLELLADGLREKSLEFAAQFPP